MIAFSFEVKAMAGFVLSSTMRLRLYTITVTANNSCIVRYSSPRLLACRNMEMVQVQREGAENGSRLCREAAGNGPGNAPDVLLPLPAGPPPPPPGPPAPLPPPRFSTPMPMLIRTILICKVLPVFP